MKTIDILGWILFVLLCIAIIPAAFVGFAIGRKTAEKWRV